MIFGSPTKFGAQPRLSSTVSNNRFEIAPSYVETNIAIAVAIRVVSCRVVSRRAVSASCCPPCSELCYRYFPLSDAGAQAQHDVTAMFRSEHRCATRLMPSLGVGRTLCCEKCML
jgi:hypothetical protein